MSDNLSALEDWAGALLAKLEPAERRRLNQQLARELRRSQQQRIASQRNPDGSSYAPRQAKKNLRGKQGRIKRQMFSKLRAAKYLKTTSSESRIGVAFLGRTARIARIHQYGLRDAPERGQPDAQYPKRELLGFSQADLELIRDGLLNHLAP